MGSVSLNIFAPLCCLPNRILVRDPARYRNPNRPHGRTRDIRSQIRPHGTLPCNHDKNSSKLTSKVQTKHLGARARRQRCGHNNPHEHRVRPPKRLNYRIRRKALTNITRSKKRTRLRHTIPVPLPKQAAQERPAISRTRPSIVSPPLNHQTTQPTLLTEHSKLPRHRLRHPRQLRRRRNEHLAPLVHAGHVPARNNAHLSPRLAVVQRSEHDDQREQYAADPSLGFGKGPLCAERED